MALFKHPKECLVTTISCLHFEVWPAAVRSLWGYRGELFCNMSLLCIRSILLYSSHVTFQESILTQTCLCSVYEHKYIFFYTQRKAVTEHRYLTCPCRDILIQWEQGRVMYCSVTWGNMFVKQWKEFVRVCRPQELYEYPISICMW